MASVFNPPSSHGNGFPLGLAGATAATRYVGATASGAPASGTFAVGDFSIDQTGNVYICTVAGSPGTWVTATGSGIPNTILDAKGDLIAATAADTASRLAVGAEGQSLHADPSTATGLVWGAGITQLYDSTLGGDAASIDSGAGGFSGAYDQLVVSMLLRTTEAVVGSTAVLTFNADTGANYDSQRVTGANATASAGNALAAAGVTFSVPGASAQAGAAGPNLLWLTSYAQTTFHKSGLLLGGLIEDTAADNRTDLRGVRWRNTAAITRVTITSGSGNLLTGSRMTVYGIG